MEPSTHAASQYMSTSSKLTTRMAIYAYSTNPQSWFAWLAEQLDLAGSVLEVGAGTGELWRHVNHSSINLTLTDFSPAMCARLRDVEGAAVRQCDAAALPFPDASFDFVIASHMLYHVNDPNAALREFARVLRPRGQVIVSLPGRQGMPELFGLAESIGVEFVVRKTTKITAETAEEFLKQHFDGVKRLEYHGGLEVPSTQPLLDYLGSMTEHGLTAEQEETARRVIEERLAEEKVFRIKKCVFLYKASRP